MGLERPAPREAKTDDAMLVVDDGCTGRNGVAREFSIDGTWIVPAA